MPEGTMHTFIDLGAFNGDTIDLAIRHLPRIDMVYGFEPLAIHCKTMKERFRDRGFCIINAAADTRDGKSQIFLGSKHGDIASSIHEGNPNCSAESEIIDTIDFPHFLREKFGANSQPGSITLKLNIEGTEYRILEQMIHDGTIRWINRIYCDWHWYFIGMTEEQHHSLVTRLRKLGYDLCGGKPDELYHCTRVGKFRTWFLKRRVHYSRSLKLSIKHRFPALFRSLKRMRHGARSPEAKPRREAE